MEALQFLIKLSLICSLIVINKQTEILALLLVNRIIYGTNNAVNNLLIRTVFTIKSFVLIN